jgi:hypothetical protein
MIIKPLRHYKLGLIERLNDKDVKESNPSNKYRVTLPEGKLTPTGDNYIYALTIEEAKERINSSLFG